MILRNRSISARVLSGFANQSMVVGILFLIVVLLPRHGVAQSLSLQFDEANEALQNQQYAQALSGYRSILQQDRQSGALHLNMAYCYIQLDSLGKAKYHLMRAERFDETEDQATEGLLWLEDQFSRTSAILPSLPWDQLISYINRNWGASFTIAMGLVLLNLIAIVWVYYWLRLKTSSSLLRNFLISATGIALAITLLGFYTQYVDQRYSTAVMVHQESILRDQPHADAPPITKAYEGYTFRIDHRKTQETGEHTWLYVRMSNGAYGWIPKSDLLIL
ncbi:MAG: tetratricopeptide repeat protein [Bacteroidota bacterium]